MKNDDAKLIQRVLDGDDTAFSRACKQTPKTGAHTRVAENWRFSCRRRDYARYLSKSVSEPFDAQGAAEVCRLALCDSDELLQDVDA